MYLVDTNVRSEARRGNVAAARWLRGVDPLLVYVSVVTIGEIMKGAALKRSRDAVAGQALQDWLAGILQRHDKRILNVDSDVMLAWGQLQAVRPRPVMDCLIAATALVHGKIVVTRNEADFADSGVEVFNPLSVPG
jgi:predicted nucleic acid-binding protein